MEEKDIELSTAVQEIYGHNLCSYLNNFRKQELLCDTTLIVEGQTFRAHRNVLAASSGYFLGLFTTDMKEGRESQVSLEGFKSFIMEDLLNYIYTGEVKINDSNVKELVSVADYLLINSLKEKGSRHLKDTLQPGNCLSTRQFAEKYQCKELLEKAEEYVSLHFVSVSKSEEFLGLAAEQVTELLTDDEITVDSEEQVYEAVVSWVYHDLDNHRQFFPDLLKCVRLPSISKYYLVEFMEKEELLMSNLECIQLLYRAMKTFALPNHSFVEKFQFSRPRKCLSNHVEAIVTIWGPGDEIRSSTQCFVPSEDQWYNLSPMLIPRFSHGAAECEGFIYTMGGVSLNGHLSSTERFDYRTNTWAGVAPMTREVSALGVTELNGFLYAIGGWNRGRPLDTAARYDPRTNKWESIKPLTTARGGPCVISSMSSLYAIGGKTESARENESYVYLKSVERYEHRTNTWSDVTPMQTCRAYACGLAVKGKLYVIGGTQDDLLSSHDSCEIYDPVEASWSFIGKINIPRALAGIAYACNKIYILGGKKSCRERTDKVECYEPELNAWRIVGSVPNCMGGIQCCSVNLSTDILNSLSKIS